VAGRSPALDREAGTDTTVAIPCGSTREAVCLPCAYRSAAYRRQQRTEGWRLTHEPDQPEGSDTYASNDHPNDGDQEEEDDQTGLTMIIG
jgi:hypothetical protein